MNSIKTFFEGADDYIQAFNQWAEQVVPPVIVDHLCFKCGSKSEFEDLRRLFELSVPFLYQSVIAGRLIAIIKLSKPIVTALGEIYYLELSDQKPDNSQVSGFDHIEIYPKEGEIEVFVEELSKKGIDANKVVRPHHTTYDYFLKDQFKIRIENEPLIEKIKREEM